MPVIDLGYVIGPRGPQGQNGQNGADSTVPGPAGPNQISASTATAFTGLLKGNGTVVGQVALDTSLTNASSGVPSSQQVWQRVAGIYSRSYTTGAASYLRIPSTALAVYLVVINRRSSGDRAPYVAVVTYFEGNVSIQQLTNNTVTMTAGITSTGGTPSGLKIGIPTYSSGFVISDNNFDLNVSES